MSTERKSTPAWELVARINAPSTNINAVELYRRPDRRHMVRTCINGKWDSGREYYERVDAGTVFEIEVRAMFARHYKAPEEG